MSEELRPCPFCGGNDIAISADENQGNKWGSAVCFSCSAVGPEVRTGYETYPEASWRAEAAAEWNRRAPMTAPTPAGEEGERRVHTLKTWPPYFSEVKSGKKPFELRKNDRDYRVGDWLRLLEWLPAMECYTGEEHAAQITYVLDGGQFGLESGYCILGLSSPRVEEVRREAIEEAASAVEGMGWSTAEQAFTALEIALLIRSLSPTDKQARG